MARRQKFDVKLPSTQAYIYIMFVPKSQKKKCYVGQSAAANFSRLKTHFDNTYNNRTEDKSTELIREWPLKYIDFYCYFGTENGSTYFGIPKEVFIEFFHKFRPVGGQRISNDDKVSAEIRKTSSGITINLDFLDDEEEIWTPSVGDILNAAEILWSCKMQMLGYEMLNADMGGQQIVWEYQDLNGDWIPITANKTTISQFTKILISSFLDNNTRALLSSLKNKIDPLIEEMLNENFADLMSYSIVHTLTNTQNLMSKDSTVDLRKTIIRVITAIFNGTAKQYKVFNSDLYKAFPNFIRKLIDTLTPEERQLLGDVDIAENVIVDSPIITNLVDSLVQDLAGKLTTSLLKLDKKLFKNSIIDWTFYVKNNIISVRGKNGYNEKNDIQQSFTASVEQMINPKFGFTIESNIGSLLRSGISHPDYILPDEIKWNWTVNRFNKIISRVKDETKGLVAISNNPKQASELALLDGNYALLPKKTAEEREDTLSARVRKEYMNYLSVNNLIISKWRTFFSNLYSAGDSRWEVTTIEEGDIAFLKNDTIIKQISVDPVKIGFFIDDKSTFFISGSNSLKKAYVIF